MTKKKIISTNEYGQPNDSEEQFKQALPGTPKFPVVGIGASAGGFDAICRLLEFLPEKLGMAYVIVQHLLPTQESILPELLEKRTAMKVNQVTNGMTVEPDNVYVIPENTFMSISANKLILSPRAEFDGGNHSIDHFLISLAAANQHNSVAVILSGTASDGTVGVQHVKSAGGITFAQDESAQFQGMPKSAADSGFVDFVLSPEAIAKELSAIVKHPYAKEEPSESFSSKDLELKKIYLLLNRKKNVDFSYYKQTTINRRILRRMALNRLKQLDEYASMLRVNEQELDQLYKDLLINVTSFFREPLMYDALAKTIFPVLVKQKKPSEPIRIWCTACATGEEAYSIAICLFEYLKEQSVTTPIQIFATDLNEAGIEKARLGSYAAATLQGLSPQRLERFFTRIDGKYQVNKFIRDVCIFAPHNLLKDPPFSKMDLISCQNIMIYLEAVAQKKLLQSFHYALNRQGFLLLGKSETIGSATDLFSPLDKDLKIYTKKETVSNINFNFSLPESRFSMNSPQEGKNVPQPGLLLDIEREADKLLLSKYVPASLLVNSDLQIIRFNGIVAGYLQPVAGKATLSLLKMVRDELVFEVRNLIHKSKKDGQVAKRDGIAFNDNGFMREVNVEVLPVKASSKDVHFLIIFREATPGQAAARMAGGTSAQTEDYRDERINILEMELRDAREQMKSMSEEFEATREELQSANEEVLSSNEELQSINEELETSKEELQSTNEELMTINEELQQRNSELNDAVEYTRNIVETIHEPLLVLNADLRVRSANRAFYSNFKNNVADVEGQYFFDIDNGQWAIEELKAELNELLHKNLRFHELEVTQVFKGIGQKTLRFHAMRMNTDNGKNNRLLLVIEDITEAKKTELELKDNAERFRLIIQNAFDIITIFAADGTVKYESESINRILGYGISERIGKNILKDQIVHPDDLYIKVDMFHKALANPNENVRKEFRLRHKDGSYRIMEAVCINLLNEPLIGGIVANYRDVTDKRLLEKQKDEFIGIASHELKTPVTSIKAYAEILNDRFTSSDDKQSAMLVEKLNRQVDRLTNLIRDLLDVTKMSEGQLQLHNQLFDINGLINEVVEEQQRIAKKHNIKRELSPCKLLTADRERTGQVLTNLISNAIKYSPAAEEVIVTSECTEDHITVCVQDFGIGISSDMQGRVFDRFFRGNDPNINTFPGLGLGLYISAEIIKRQHGTISVRSEKNKGSLFCFTLPYSKPE